MRWATTLALVLLMFSGCGKGLPVAPVSGTITFGGKPLVGASITTQPIATDTSNPGPGSFGRTDADGNFELELVTPAIKGAIIGEHRVMISPSSGDSTSGHPEQSQGGELEQRTDDPQGHLRAGGNRSWPQRYADGTLRLQVPPEGTNDVRFDLTR